MKRQLCPSGSTATVCANALACPPRDARFIADQRTAARPARYSPGSLACDVQEACRSAVGDSSNTVQVRVEAARGRQRMRFAGITWPAMPTCGRTTCRTAADPMRWAPCCYVGHVQLGSSARAFSKTPKRSGGGTVCSSSRTWPLASSVPSPFTPRILPGRSISAAKVDRVREPPFLREAHSGGNRVV